MIRKNRRQTMFKLVEQYQISGMLKRHFCTRHRIKLSTFSWWQHRYRKENNGSGKKTSSRPLFIPVKGSIDLIRSGFEYRFHDGSLLSIPATTAIQNIINLVNGLHRTSCSQ
ncbi:MAG: hypothetical protein ABIA63_02675 [bacterium]